jgi:hypothetical protein
VVVVKNHAHGGAAQTESTLGLSRRQSKKPKVVAVEESRSIYFDGVGPAPIWDTSKAIAPSQSLTLPEKLSRESINGRPGMPSTTVVSPVWDLYGPKIGMFIVSDGGYRRLDIQGVVEMIYEVRPGPNSVYRTGHALIESLRKLPGRFTICRIWNFLHPPLRLLPTPTCTISRPP